MIARFSLSEGGDEVHPSYIPILHPDIYCSNWLLVMAQFENLGELGVSGFSWLVIFLLSV